MPFIKIVIRYEPLSSSLIVSYTHLAERGRVVRYFYLVNVEFVSRAMWISSCKNICRQKLLNMDKTFDFVIKSFKI